MFDKSTKSNRNAGIMLICLAAFFGIMSLISPQIYANPLFMFIILGLSALLAIFWGFLFSLIGLVFIIEVYSWLTEDGKKVSPVHLDLSTPIPAEIMEIADKIESFGFTKLGVKSVVQKNGKQYNLWVWVDETQTVLAYLANANLKKPFASFETRYSDGYEVETTYNWFSNVDGENILVNNFNSSVDEAYDFHMHFYPQHLNEHGQPKFFETLSDTDSTIEERKRNQKHMQAAQIRSSLPVVLICGTFMLVFILCAYLTSIAPQYVMFVFFFILGLLFMFVDEKTLTSHFKPVNERKPRKALEQ